MRLTVLGGCGAWPAAGQACSGYLLEHQGFRLLIDPGYAIVPRLLHVVPAAGVDAVLVSHGHPDHCADLHPLLRARVLDGERPPPLPVYAPRGALAPVLDLDGPGTLAHAYALRELTPGRRLEIGPFQLDTWLLPHFVPNLGLRLHAGGRVLAYTGDTGPSPDLAVLARGADLFLAEATFAVQMPDRFAGNLSTAQEAGENAARAAVDRLLLTHLWPGQQPEAMQQAAATRFSGPVAVAAAGTVLELGGARSDQRDGDDHRDHGDRPADQPGERLAAVRGASLVDSVEPERAEDHRHGTHRQAEAEAQDQR